MSSRSSSASSTFTYFTTTSTSSSSSCSLSTPPPPPPPPPPPRYSTHFEHLSPTADFDAKHLPQVVPQHQPQENQQKLHPQARWTPLSSHGLPRPPLPGQVLQRSRTRTRVRSASVSAPTMRGAVEGEPPRSQSRPKTTHRQTQSLGVNGFEHRPQQHCSSNYVDAENEQEEYGERNAAGQQQHGQREKSEQAANGSIFKLKHLRSKVAGWRERERERRREAREDVVEVGVGGHWSEY